MIIGALTKQEKRKFWYETNKEKLKAKRKIYNAKNAEKIAEREATYYEKNKEKIAAYSKEYQKTYVPTWESKEYMKLYRENNKVKIAEYQKAYAKTEVGQESLRQSQSIYDGSVKGRFNHSVQDARRRSRLADQTPRLTTDDRKRINKLLRVQRQLKADGIMMHVDHIIPLVKGGVHHPDNLQLLPVGVNLQKADRLDFVIPEGTMVIRA